MSVLRLRPLSRVAAVLGLALAVGACDAAEEILSSVDVPPAPARATQLTIWTSDPSPSPIAVVVNGQTHGTLTYYRTSAPPCGDRTAGASITVELNPGQHVLTAFETQGDGTWGPTTISLGTGQCLTHELTP